MATHYGILKVAPDAPADVIRAAYRVLAAHHHPDRCAGDRDALQRMQWINEAYRVLGDPQMRARYDATLRQQRRRRAGDGDAGVPSTAMPAGSGPVQPVTVRQRAAAVYAAHATLDSGITRFGSVAR